MWKYKFQSVFRGLYASPKTVEPKIKFKDGHTVMYKGGGGNILKVRKATLCFFTHAAELKNNNISVQNIIFRIKIMLGNTFYKYQAVNWYILFLKTDVIQIWTDQFVKKFNKK